MTSDQGAAAPAQERKAVGVCARCRGDIFDDEYTWSPPAPLRLEYHEYCHTPEEQETVGQVQAKRIENSRHWRVDYPDDEPPSYHYIPVEIEAAIASDARREEELRQLGLLNITRASLRYEIERHERTEAEVERLRTALAPLAGLLDRAFEDQLDDWTLFAFNEKPITYGDVRRASALLDGRASSPEEGK